MTLRLLCLSMLAACTPGGVLHVDDDAADDDDDALADDTASDTAPGFVLEPPDYSETGFLVLLADVLGVVWTPTVGGTAWGGDDSDVGWPDPYGRWFLTEDAPRGAILYQGSRACVASTDEVSCRGNIDRQWPTRWPQRGVVDISHACALLEGDDVRCLDAAYDPLDLPPAVRLAMRVGNVGCVLDAEGVPTCWAHDTTPAPTLPPVARRWREVELSPYLSCGITPSGEAWCQEEGTSDAVSLGGRPPLRGLVAADASACAVDADGVPRCRTWGEHVHHGLEAMPATLTGVTAIGLSYDAVCVLRDATDLACWGEGTVVSRMPELR